MLSFKEVYDKYGHYTVFLVNEEEVRNQSIKLQEFSNYGIYSDFPHLIPKHEIWISNHISEDERFILINEALCRIRHEKNGASPKKAYEIALKHDKAMRHKFLHSKHIIIPTRNHPSRQIYLKHYGTFKNIEIYIVDGTLVRDFYKTDFVEGGHDYVYHFVPRGEIWIDAEVEENERILIIIHELIERELMKNKHLSYNKAHEQASKLEWRFRNQSI